MWGLLGPPGPELRDTGGGGPAMLWAPGVGTGVGRLGVGS